MWYFKMTQILFVSCECDFRISLSDPSRLQRGSEGFHEGQLLGFRDWGIGWVVWGFEEGTGCLRDGGADDSAAAEWSQAVAGCHLLNYPGLSSSCFSRDNRVVLCGAFPGRFSSWPQSLQIIPSCVQIR